MNRRRATVGLVALVALAGSCTKKQAHELRVESTAAGLEVLHADVAVYPAQGGAVHPHTSARIEKDGRVVTGREGRAVVRTDDGLELRLAGDTELALHDGRVRVVRGRVFASSWGDEERALEVGPAVSLALSDTGAEIEGGDAMRVIAVRGEAGWRAGNRQGRIAQGESLEGHGADVRARPAGVWEDWTGGVASPHGASPRGALGTGVALLHQDAGEAPAQLAVNEHRVSVSIEGDVAVTTVSQRFFNGSDRTAPVEYRVKLPDGALVAGFGVDRGSAMSTATPATVASLSSGGGRAALLAAPDGGLFARLDPIAPGQTVRCELRYVQWLAHDGASRAYTYPMGDPIAPPFEGEFAFELSSDRANVGAMRGPAGSLVEGSRLRYARSDFRPRADLVVDLFDAQPVETPSARLWQSYDRDSRGARFLLADLTVPAPDDVGTDLVVVLDDSAAIDRGPLSVAGAAVDAMLQQLGPRDRLALMFGDLHARPAAGTAGELGPVNPARREAILDAIAHAQPGGATDLHRQLAEAYARLDPRRNGAVVYLGDAMPTMGALDPEQLVDETLRVAPDLRLYVVAIGDDPHPEVLRRLAERGGLVVQASDQAEAVSAAQRVAAHATRPVLRGVNVDLGTNVDHPLPAVIDPWVVGDPLRVTGELTGAPPHTVIVTARVNGEPRRWALPGRVDTVHEEGDIRRRWGLARLENLEDQGASRGTLADLGVRFGLITRTSALVLDAPAQDADGNAGLDVAASEWPDVGMATRLPRLGLSDGLEPRGVPSIFAEPEYPMVTDDGAGWQPHVLGEGSWVTDMLGYALTAADDAAEACVTRARRLRPTLQGSVTVSATIAADGHVTSANVDSGLGDTNADSCIRRAVASLALPPPSLYGAQPGTVRHTFEFPNAFAARVNGTCPATARLSRTARMTLWRERLANHPNDTLTVFNDALFRCEVRVWEDRTALLDLIVRAANDASDLVTLRAQLDKEHRTYLDRAVARRWGPSRLYRAYMVTSGFVNWDSLLRRLGDPALPLDRKIEIARAYRVIAPGDIDLRLRLMSLYEEAGRTREARHLADELRRDPYADTRVRARVGELLIRAGERDEGLRALSEIVEYAPYDTGARADLGDLLLTYGGRDWAPEAYSQYQTLAALRPGDAVPRVRMALAALISEHEDEALRILRAVAEDTGGDATATAVEGLFAAEVARLAAAHPNEPAVQGWLRVAALMRVAREGGLVARWTHPDVGIEIRAQQSGDPGFVTVGGDDSIAVPVRVFSPGTAMEGSRVLVRATHGLTGARTVTAHLSLVRPDDNGPRVIERDVTLGAHTRVAAFIVRGGALVEDTSPLPPAEQPAAVTEL